MRTKHLLSTLLLSTMTLAGWIGCQTSPDQSSAASDLSAGQGAELFLAVDTSEACVALRTALVSGTAVDSAAFAEQCIVEIADAPVPPIVAPDSGLRCRWIKARIDSGDGHLIPFARADRNICDSLKTTDTASFNKRCKLPPPPPPAVKRARCDSLKAALDAMDTTSSEFLRARHEFAHKCLAPNPPPPPPVRDGRKP